VPSTGTTAVSKRDGLAVALFETAVAIWFRMVFGQADHLPSLTEHATAHAQATQEPSEVESSRQPAPADYRGRFFCANFSQHKGISQRRSPTARTFRVPSNHILKSTRKHFSYMSHSAFSVLLKGCAPIPLQTKQTRKLNASGLLTQCTATCDCLLSS
jgi:hypothetical protein